jgi:flagellar basal body-associated protein FliL
MMESRFKSNNFIAILIALILVATGFALAFVHRHSESEANQEKKPIAALTAAATDKPTYIPGNISA